jgi:hypothetical protein
LVLIAMGSAAGSAPGAALAGAGAVAWARAAVAVARTARPPSAAVSHRAVRAARRRAAPGG